LATGSSLDPAIILNTQGPVTYSLYVPTSALTNLTSRIEVQIWAVTTSGIATFKLEMRDSTLSNVVTTIASNLIGATGPTGPTGPIGPTGSFQTGYYGSFSDSTTQTNFSTEKALTFDTTELSNGVSIGTPSSHIVVSNSGTYNFQFSAQISLSSGASETITIWFAKNGNPIPRSATNVTLKNTNEYYVAAWNYVDNFNSGEYFEIIALSNDIHARMEAVPAAGSVPAIPSVILTVTQV
jgi:hypothetical protein